MEMGHGKTRRLYEEQPYTRKMAALVMECMEMETKPKSEKCFGIVLDQTVFYPEGGGQPGDRGYLTVLESDGAESRKRIAVFDTREWNGKVVHMTAEAIPCETRVEGSIDWDTRYGYMQNHTGEHMVSGCVHRKYGYDNVGFHMGKDAVVIDFNGELDWEQLMEIEEDVNDIVDENRRVEIHYPSREELKTTDYRSKKEIDGQVRLVMVPDCDCCACCGLHVAQTAEVQMIKILSVQNHRGGVRVELICGKDAREDYRKKHQQVMEITRLLSAKAYETAEAVKRLVEENGRLKGKIGQLQMRRAEEKVACLPEGHQSVFLYQEDCDLNQLRHLVNLARGKAVHVMAVTPGTRDGEFRYIIGSSENAVAVATAVNAAFSGRGGGSAPMAQGSCFGRAEDIGEFFQQTVGGQEEKGNGKPQKGGGQ